ncbi:MAG: hypothetical protein ACRERV_02725, partial [Methylococcales bacterium]
YYTTYINTLAHISIYRLRIQEEGKSQDRKYCGTSTSRWAWTSAQTPSRRSVEMGQVRYVYQPMGSRAIVCKELLMH